MPIRNLVRHKREYPDPRDKAAVGPFLNAPVGADPLMPATDDDYELRRSRTPVPTFVPETVDSYLGKIFARKVQRELPDGPFWDLVRAWWRDVDGRRTALDAWLQNEVFRTLLACGNVDVMIVHPTPPEGVEVRTRYDEITHNLTGAVARVILPQNLAYWELDSKGDYTLALVQEWTAGGDSDPRYVISQFHPAIQFQQPQTLFRPRQNYRLWLPDQWVLYDDAGKKLDEKPHPFGRVPIVRLFCRRKPRCTHVGQSPIESIAERQREYYNRDSELILSDSLQAHPVIQCAEDLIGPDGSVGVGPSSLLPKKKVMTATGVHYEPFSVLDFPKGAAESLRQNKDDIRDDVDRDANLTKPAGTAGTGRSTVSQSGVSKELDNEGLHDRLGLVASILETAEMRILELVCLCLSDGKPPPLVDPKGEPIVTLRYPRSFSLRSAEQIAAIWAEFQAGLSGGGDCPETDALFACELVRKALPGHDDQTYEMVDDEIKAFLAKKQEDRETLRENLMAAPPPGLPGLPPPGEKPPEDEPDEDENPPPDEDEEEKK